MDSSTDLHHGVLKSDDRELARLQRDRDYGGANDPAISAFLSSGPFAVRHLDIEEATISFAWSH